MDVRHLGTLVLGAIVAVAIVAPTTAATESGERHGVRISDAPRSKVSSKPVMLGTGKGKKNTDPVFSDHLNRHEKVKPCRNDLVLLLREVGFKGDNLREAWAIAMRESHGQGRVISSTSDYGLYQFNKASFDGEKWWNSSKLLKKRYNAKVAYRMSDGGRTWYPWGLDGKGNVKAHVYVSAGWSYEKIDSHIRQPYEKYVKEFRNLPRSCRRG